ncbi:MAG: sugar transferase [Nitrospinae bacterium]|nr:sugar transferase [Nitrospinota bacterium]
MPVILEHFQGGCAPCRPASAAGGRNRGDWKWCTGAVGKIPGHAAWHQVRPGLTELGQIYAPRDIPGKHTCRYDALYIKQQSCWLNLKRIALSFWITIRGTWEDRGQTFSHPFPVPAALPLASAFPACLPSPSSHMWVCHRSRVSGAPPHPLASPCPVRREACVAAVLSRGPGVACDLRVAM